MEQLTVEATPAPTPEPVEERVSAEEPFPGLRCFREGEGEFFFGRQSHSSALALRLYQSGFIAVVGPSGSGKSSLVRSGLVEVLADTYDEPLVVVTFAPRANPYANFAHALHRKLFGKTPEPAATRTPTEEALEEILRQGQDGFIRIVRDYVPPRIHLLVIIDQFEEMMRMARPASPDDTDRFVAMLICSVKEVKEERKRRQMEEAEDAELKRAAAPTDRLGTNLSMALTMRSEYLGAAALFRGLPELLTDHQYLTPRMTPAQLRQAIEGPLEKAKKGIEEGLVDRLLNDVAILEARWSAANGPRRTDGSAATEAAKRGGFDTLPVFQFALRQLWGVVGSEPKVTHAHYTALIEEMKAVCQRTAKAAAQDYVRQEAPAAGTISSEDRRKRYIMQQAESLQQDSPLRLIFSGAASRLYEKASFAHQKVIRLAFMRLCGQGDGTTLDVRRPTRRSELAAVANTFPDKVDAALKPFTDRDVCFLQIEEEESDGTESDPVYDISHESLIRQWHELDGWVREEARLSRILRRMTDNSEFAARLGLASAEDMALLEDIYRVYPDGEAFNAWTRRYIVAEDQKRFENYYKESKQAQSARERREQIKRRLMITVPSIVIAVSGLFLASYFRTTELERITSTHASEQKATTTKFVTQLKEKEEQLIAARVDQRQLFQYELNEANQMGALPDRAVVKPTPPPQEATNARLGFDINEYAAVTDWKAVAKRVGYVYIRATLPGSQDERFVEHWNAADKAGLSVGAFHVFNANVSGQTQADAFCDALKQTESLKDRPEEKLLRESDMPAMVYAWSLGRTDPHTAIRRFHNCLMRIHKRTGKRPLIQTNPYFWKENFEKRFEGKKLEYRPYERLFYYPLALSHYTKDRTKVTIPKLWKDNKLTWAIWHYTDQGELPSLRRRNNRPTRVTLSQVNDTSPVQWVRRASHLNPVTGEADLNSTMQRRSLLSLLKKYEPQAFDEQTEE